MQTTMNDPQSKSPAQVAETAREESAELRELRKKLLDHIVRSRTARRDRPANTSTPPNHTQRT
jgi:hypothetical protein